MIVIASTASSEEKERPERSVQGNHRLKGMMYIVYALRMHVLLVGEVTMTSDWEE
jgi:hypothetical protein